jgi:hypothetical protein
MLIRFTTITGMLWFSLPENLSCNCRRQEWQLDFSGRTMERNTYPSSKFDLCKWHDMVQCTFIMCASSQQKILQTDQGSSSTRSQTPSGSNQKKIRHSHTTYGKELHKLSIMGAKGWRYAVHQLLLLHLLVRDNQTLSQHFSSHKQPIIWYPISMPDWGWLYATS